VTIPDANGPRVLRVAHHAVVSQWRERERQLRVQGVDITLVSAQRWNEGGSELPLEAGSDEFVIGVRTLGSHPNLFVYDPRPLWRLLGDQWDLIDLHEEPCAAATAEILGLRRLRGLRTPFLLYSAQNIPKRYPIPFRWWERYALRRAAGAYVCNSEAGEILRRKGLQPTARLIGLGTDLAMYTPGAHSAPRVPLRVGYVGRLEPHKGVEVLLQAIAGVPGCVLEIAGDGPQRAELAELAERLAISDRVTFHGHVGERLPDFYRDLDVLVVPSLPTPGWLEQFGRVVVEAMASGVPVIASRSGALPDVVGSAGLLVEPGDRTAIQAGLVEISDPQRWALARTAGLEHCRQYDWPAVAAQHRELYADVLAQPSADVGAGLPPQVVVVAYGPPEPLAEALEPLTGFSVTVVDNSSSTQTREMAERHHAHYIDAGANLGFAAGVNRALASLDERGLADADVLLLNPDARIQPDSIRALQVELHRSPRLACVGPAQKHPQTGVSERVVWPFPSLVAAWLGAFGLGALDRRHGFVIGSVLLLRRAALADVGRFDERFFLYAEETDWQFRAVRRGWTTGLVPAASATHVGGGTSDDSVLRDELFHRSLLKFFAKHRGVLGEFSFRCAMVVGAALRLLVSSRERRAAARWRLRFYTNEPRPTAFADPGGGFR